MTRRNSRIAVIQALYQFEVSDKSEYDYIVEEFSSFRNGKIATTGNNSQKFEQSLFEDLFKKTVENLAQIDDLVAKQLTDSWPINRIDLVILSILRAGVCELFFFQEIPFKVTLNEYVEISKRFISKDKERIFINGLLNGFAKTVTNKNVDKNEK